MEATPISGPALICIPQSDSFERELPTVFVTPIILALAEWQYRRALRVSAVSPLINFFKHYAVVFDVL